MARNGGFTLLEMLIVFSVVLVLAALAVPTLGGAVRHQEEMYMLAVLRADLYGAQQHAIARRVNVAVFLPTVALGTRRLMQRAAGRLSLVRSLLRGGFGSARCAIRSSLPTTATLNGLEPFG